MMVSMIRQSNTLDDTKHWYKRHISYVLPQIVKPTTSYLPSTTSYFITSSPFCLSTPTCRVSNFPLLNPPHPPIQSKPDPSHEAICRGSKGESCLRCQGGCEEGADASAGIKRQSCAASGREHWSGERRVHWVRRWSAGAHHQVTYFLFLFFNFFSFFIAPSPSFLHFFPYLFIFLKLFFFLFPTNVCSKVIL